MRSSGHQSKPRATHTTTNISRQHSRYSSPR
nr:MAG TPA: hypothetical protein [Caudoviricetes sp.]